MANLKIPARALVVVMVVAMATPAFADPSNEDKRAAAQAKQAEAANVAAERKKAATDKLATLQKARDDQARLKGALDERIAEVTNEVAALGREEADLTALIKARQLPPGAGDSPAAANAPASKV